MGRRLVGVEKLAARRWGWTYCPPLHPRGYLLGEPQGGEDYPHLRIVVVVVVVARTTNMDGMTAVIHEVSIEVLQFEPQTTKKT